MIDWRIVLGALAGGVALTCWLESRHRLMQTQIVAARLLQGTAVFIALLAVWMFAVANDHPIQKQNAASLGAKTAVLPSTPTPPPTLAPPSVFVLTPPAQPFTNQPRHEPTFPSQSYLHIPELNISQPIVDLPLQNGLWDVSQLGEKIGHLASTGTHPGDTLAPVFAGHMTFPQRSNPDKWCILPTCNMQSTTQKSTMKPMASFFIYKITEISRVAPTAVEQLYLEDGNSILLTTCTDWDTNGRFYTNRLLIRAHPYKLTKSHHFHNSLFTIHNSLFPSHPPPNANIVPP